MANISVNPLDFTYKQFDAVPASVLIEFSSLIGSELNFLNVPGWLSISDKTIIDDDEATAVFVLNTSQASTLSPGIYTVVVEVASKRDTVDPVHGAYRKEGELTVNLTLTETIVLEVSSENITFNYDFGGTVPASKLITVTSEQGWTVTNSAGWISTSVASGSNNGSFSISVDPSGLSAATHTGTVTVADGTNTKIINISFVISDGNTDIDFLYVTPTEIEFVKNIGSTINPLKTISINSSGSWTAAATETWLVLSASSGSSGSDLITLSLDVTGLLPGVFTAELAVSAGSFLRKVYVTFYFNDTTIVVPESGVYFAEDDVRLELASNNDNSFLDVDFKAIFNSISELYKKTAPFIKGSSTVNIGEEISNLIKSTEIPASLASKITTLLKPVDLAFTAYEKDYFTSELYEVVERNSLSFFNGKTPLIPNKFCNIPTQITATRNSAIALHIYSTSAPLSIRITGAITETITVTDAADSNVYSGIINLKEFNLKPLDIITITFGFLSITVRITEDCAESVLLSFENEWNLPELIELTGSLTIGGSANFSTQTMQVGNTTHEKIYSTLPGENFTIYTGWIESAAEIMWLNKILNSEKMFLYINEDKIEVIPTFKTLNTYVSREYQKNYKLTFKKAIV